MKKSVGNGHTKQRMKMEQKKKLKSKSPVETTQKSKKKESAKDKEKRDKQVENKPLRDKHDKLLPGNTANPNGRPKGTCKIDALNEAIRRVEKTKNKSFLDMVVEKAWTDTTLAVAVLKKLHPDLKAIEQTNIAADSMDDEVAADIREIRRQGFEALVNYEKYKRFYEEQHKA